MFLEEQTMYMWLVHLDPHPVIEGLYGNACSLKGENEIYDTTFSGHTSPPIPILGPRPCVATMKIEGDTTRSGTKLLQSRPSFKTTGRSLHLEAVSLQLWGPKDMLQICPSRAVSRRGCVHRYMQLQYASSPPYPVYIQLKHTLQTMPYPSEGRSSG